MKYRISFVTDNPTLVMEALAGHANDFRIHPLATDNVVEIKPPKSEASRVMATAQVLLPEMTNGGGYKKGSRPAEQTRGGALILATLRNAKQGCATVQDFRREFNKFGFKEISYCTPLAALVKSGLVRQLLRGQYQLRAAKQEANNG